MKRQRSIRAGTEDGIISMRHSYEVYEASARGNRTLCTILMRHKPYMDTPSVRLRKAREAAGFATVADAARAWRVNQNTLTSHENGNRPLSRGAAAIYAARLGLTAGYLLYGEGAPEPVEDEEADAAYEEFRELKPAQRAVVRQMMQTLLSASSDAPPIDPVPSAAPTKRKTPRARRTA